MKRYKQSLVAGFMLCFLCCLAVWVNVSGLQWGLPSESRRDVILQKNDQNEHVYVSMVKEHAKLFEDSQSIFVSKSLRKATVDGYMPHAQHDISEESSLVRSVERSFLIRTFEPDLTNLMNAFSRLDPKRFDFFPDTFCYGIAYFLITGFFLKCAELVRIISVQSDLLFYLKNVSEMGKIYVMLRGINVFYSALTAWVVYASSRRFYSKKLACFAALLFLLIPTTLISNYVVKPHTLGTLFCFLQIYFLMRVLAGEQKMHLMALASMCAGFSYGVIMTNGLYGFLLLVVYVIVLRRNNWYLVSRHSARLFFTLVLPFLVIVGCFSLYLFVYPQTFIEEAQLQSNFVMVRSFWGLTGESFSFLPYIATYLGWPLVALSVIGMLLWRKMWPITVSLLGVFLVFFLFQQAAVRIRFLLPIVPFFILCALYVINVVIEGRYFKIAALLFVLITIIPCGRSIAESMHFAFDVGEGSTRLQAGQWINANVRSRALIGMHKVPVSFLCPPFHFSKYRMIITPNLLELDSPDAVLPDYIVDTQLADKKVPILENVELVPLKVFENEVWLNRLLFFQYHYYTIANPRIIVYKVHKKQTSSSDSMDYLL